MFISLNFQHHFTCAFCGVRGLGEAVHADGLRSISAVVGLLSTPPKAHDVPAGWRLVVPSGLAMYACEQCKDKENASFQTNRTRRCGAARRGVGKA